MKNKVSFAERQRPADRQRDFFRKMVLYAKILRIIRNFDATFSELLGFDVLFEGWKVETTVDLVWTCLGWFSSKD